MLDLYASVYIRDLKSLSMFTVCPITGFIYIYVTFVVTKNKKV